MMKEEIDPRPSPQLVIPAQAGTQRLCSCSSLPRKRESSFLLDDL